MARPALFLGARSAVQRHPTIRPYYARLLAAGKPKKVAPVACARKLRVLRNAIARSATPWTLDFQHSC